MALVERESIHTYLHTDIHMLAHAMLRIWRDVGLQEFDLEDV